MDNDNLKKILTRKNTKFILILVVIGLFIIFIPDIFDSAKDDIENMPASDEENLAYAKTLESRLKTIIENIDGAGKCEVMITLENGTEQVFAVESRENKTESSDSERMSYAADSEKTILTVSNGGGQQPIVVRKNEPKVRGVVIACEGADDTNTALMITEAVKTLFSIPSNSICVIKLSS